MDDLVRGKVVYHLLQMKSFNDLRSRIIRVWLPDNYDEQKKYPVIYMHDGQNLFDKSITAFGEWRVDETLGELMDNGFSGVIVVGIDFSEDRLNELCPPINGKSSIIYRGFTINPLGDAYASFIVETVKPFIDSHYSTLSDKANTYIGGSSMGGLMSYYMSSVYPLVFGGTFVLSGSFLLNGPDFDLSEYYVNKVAFYCGGKGTEGDLTDYTIRYYEDMKSKIGEDNTYLIIDKSMPHSESAWSVYFKELLKWMFRIK